MGFDGLFPLPDSAPVRAVPDPFEGFPDSQNPPRRVKTTRKFVKTLSILAQIDIVTRINPVCGTYATSGKWMLKIVNGALMPVGRLSSQGTCHSIKVF